MRAKYRHLFGPVPSRRLGMSLGVDLVPHKTCTLDCVYCEVGRTTRHTLQREEYIPTGEIIEELDDYLASSPRLDAITFSGFGEPLLHSGIGEVISHLKKNHPQYRIALLTNATLLTLPDMARELEQLDLILPSLDAVTAEVFNEINRPCPGIHPEEVIKGLYSFRASSGAKMLVELFLLPGYNDFPSELSRLREVLLSLDPDGVQLNTLDRPGTLSGLEPASPERLQRVAKYMRPLPCVVVAGGALEAGQTTDAEEVSSRILETVKRRPCTSRDLALALGRDLREVEKHLTALRQEGRVDSVQGERGMFWKAARKA